MSHSFLSPPVDLVDGHPNFALGARTLIYCTYGCRSATIQAPSNLADRRCRDGLLVGDEHATFASCPGNRPLVPPPAPPAMALAPAVLAAPIPISSAASASGASSSASFGLAADTDGEWSQSLLRQVPTSFADDDLIYALRRVRKPDAIEARLDESRHSVTSNVGDSHTDRTFIRNRWSVPRDVFDTIPRRLNSSAIRRLSQANCLLLSLISALAAPSADDIRRSLDDFRVPVADRFPGTELVGVTDDPASFPSAARVLETITALCLEVDGILVETAHFPNAARAAEDDGAVFLHGTQADLTAVRQQPLLARLYESRLDLDEACEPPIRFRPITDTLRESPHARLSVLFRTPTTWVPRKRLLRLHWRWFWHRYTVAADDVRKSQLTLQNQYTAWKDRRDQLDVLRCARSGPPSGNHRPPPPRSLGSPPATRSPGPHSGARGEAARPPKRPRRDSVHPGTGSSGSLHEVSAGLNPTLAPEPSRLAAIEPPICRAATSCGSCGAAKDARHAPDCAWVSTARASGRPLR